MIQGRAEQRPERGRRRTLGVREVCAAAALADLAAVVSVLMKLVPVGELGTLVAALPFAVLADRHRVRVCVIGAISGGAVGFLFGGPEATGHTLIAAVVGSVVGVARRRGWAMGTMLARGTLLLGLPAAALAVAGMWLLAGWRQLGFAQLLITWRGVARIITAVGLPGVVRGGDAAVGGVLGYWAVWLPVGVIIGIAMGLGGSRLLLRGPLRAVAQLAPEPLPGLAVHELPGPPVAPVPVRLRQASFSYPGSPRPALVEIDFDLACGEFVTVTGPNGAGKSTLARLLAGSAPTSGQISRPGTTGLGAPGGTAMIFQRPESQVLGVRVIDDVLWGLPPGRPIDVEALLLRVGLSGLAERETATLSGGQLQRLAIAALLARDPALVISDEATAMLDGPGRASVCQLLGSLAHREGKTVVHFTHHTGETTTSDRTVALPPTTTLPPATALQYTDQHSQVLAPGPRTAPAGPARGAVSLAGVGFVYAAGTPWAHRVLTGVNLDIPAGGGVLLTGENGAGKSTLAALLAGLAAPTEGAVLLDGQPVHNGPAGALLGLQHARLQLLGPTAGHDVASAAGISPQAADEALDALALCPRHYRHRRIDELSAGEQRRVALAGLLAARPRLLVLDEPLAGLDSPGRAALLAALGAIRATGTTLVITSHDPASLHTLLDHTATIAHGRVHPHRHRAPAPGNATAATDTAPAGGAPSAVRPRGLPKRRSSLATMLMPRTLPWSSPAHQLYAGTKIVILALIAAALAVHPTWPTWLAAAAILGAGATAARLPVSALPRIPRWLCVVIALTGALTTLGGGTPNLTILGVSIGLGALTSWALIIAITFLFLFSAQLLIWTTPLTDIPPLLQRITELGRHTRLPLLETTVTISLGLRLLPILADECRTILLLTTQRSRSTHTRGRAFWADKRHQLTQAIALACATTTRRANEMADAITARGGLGNVAHTGHHHLTPRDILAIGLTAITLTIGGAL